jgi:hypothetical protein
LGGTATPAAIALAISTAINGTGAPGPPAGDGAALLEMNNVTIRFDPADLGLWTLGLIERQTLFGPLGAEFNFSYPTIPPLVPDPPPYQFPAPWGGDGAFDFLDAWGFSVISPLEPDTRFVTFELRVDGVLLDTIEVLLTNERSNLGVPEPGAAILLALGCLGFCCRRRRLR